LIADHEPAADLLRFYGRVLESQAVVYKTAKEAGWFNELTTGPELAFDQVPVGVCLPLFQKFVRDVGASSTETLSSVAINLCKSKSVAKDILEAFLALRPVDELAAKVACSRDSVEFFARAFVQPVAEVVVGRVPGARTLSTSGRVSGSQESAMAACPRCGWPPQLAVLQDGEETRGERKLLCTLCLTEWIFPRATCPACWSTDTDKLIHHSTDVWPHIRVEECQTCRSYLKAIDLRENGLAVPVVDEIASVELDLWANEIGLRKLQRNLLGL
jgi:formate dehydrogenase accessory protein FdhE